MRVQRRNESDRECFYCQTKRHIARHCRRRTNNGGQHRDNSKGKNPSVQQRVAALEMSTSEGQAENASSVPVSSLLLTPAQLAATYVQMARHVAAKASAPAVQCEAMLPDEWPITDSDFGVGVIAEVDEPPTDDVWILNDAGSPVTVCPHGFQEELGRKNMVDRDVKLRRGNAVTLGGAKCLWKWRIRTSVFGSKLRVSPNQPCRLDVSAKLAAL